MAGPDPWAAFPVQPLHNDVVDPWAAFPKTTPAAPSPPVAPSAQPATPLQPTGQAHDGDTFRLNTGQNARLYGADAFELSQTGRTRSGMTVPLGQMARASLAAFAKPDATVTPTGDMTYGRPVASLDRNGDAGKALLDNGLGIAIPAYLKADPARLTQYMEAERDARINRRGAWAGSFEQPSSFRHNTPDPWAKPQAGTEGNSEAVFWDEPLPAQGLRPEIAQSYLDLAKDFSSTPEQLLGYAKANGFQLDDGQVRKFIADRNRDQKVNASEVSYQALPRVLTDLGDGKLGAGLRGVADPFNVLDEAGALVDSFGATNGRENLFSSDRRFGDIYANNLDQNRSILANDDSAHPYIRFAGQMAGGLVAPGASIEGLGFQAARDVLTAGGTRMAAEQAARSAVVRRLGTVGAVEGSAAGAGAGEDMRSRTEGALIGGPVGLALGVGTGVAAPVIAKAIGKPFSRLAGREGERTASDFTDGAFDTAKAASENTVSAPAADPTPSPGLADYYRQSGFNRRSGTRIVGARMEGEVGAPIRGANDGAPSDILGIDSPVIGNSRFASDDSFETVALRQGQQPFRDPANDDAGVSQNPAWWEPDMPMRSDMETPSIVSPDLGTPRQPDRIDVTARPRPMMGPATDAERRAAAARLDPNDVLPIPANTVDGVEEAARIDAGRFDPVKPPREDAGLLPNKLPNANTGTMLPKRGPADLVTWLRSEGGIKAQGRELEHYGIDNTPRRGMDFAEGENRFGPLVNSDGMTYDDAAMRAWEAGYFPDHAERPDIAEFLDALNATHTGQARAFRVDDLAELDAFHAARRQRGEVLNARDNGTPMVDDRGRPIDMADLEANAPPVRAYEEWGENAPNLAGNIRLDKLDSPQAIRRALVQTDRVTGGFDAAKRGRITQAETKSLASDLGMTVDDLLKRRSGQAFNAEQALAARQLLSRSGTDLVNMAKKLSAKENPGDDLEASFREAWLRHAAIQEQVSGMTAEAGRALSQFRMTATSRAIADRVLPSLGDVGGGSGRLKDVADRIVDLERVGTDPGSVNKFALRALSPKWKDKLTELYINSLLSGPQTHVVNMLSNTITALAQIPEHAVSAGIGAVRQAGGKALLRFGVETDAERVMFSEVGARAVGLVQGTREGLRDGLRALLTGNAVDPVTKLETQSMSAIKGPLGSVIRTPTRFLTAEDELFKGIARRMEMTGLSMRQARMEGLTGEAAKTRAGELLANPTDEMVKRSFDYARYLTFQTPLPHDSFAAGLSRGTQRRPWTKLFFPFVRTPANILKFSAERSPLGLLAKSVQADIRAGGVRRDNAVARILVGSGVGATIYSAALEGKVTGGGPLDDNARRLMQADGWQPYSFKVGDTYYSYSRLDPFSTIIGTAADMVDLGEHMTDRQREHMGMQIGAAVIANLSNKTWLSGLTSALEAINDPGRNLENFVARTAGSIAVPGFVAQVARTQDPILHEARDWQNRIRSRVPGLSDNLPARRDVFGQPITSQGGLGPDIISPIWTSKAKNDPTVKALTATDIHLASPQRSYTEGGQRIEWTPAQYDKLSALTGQVAKPQLDALTRSTQWSAMSQDKQQDAVGDIMKVARKEAKASVRGIFGAPLKADAEGPWNAYAKEPDPWAAFPEAR
jgi:endonuclease YncB( thermonuclease family)